MHPNGPPDPGSEAGEERKEALSRAREAASRLLSVRARTVSEMRDRLRRKDFDAEVVEETVTWLLDRDLLDDAAFCREFLAGRLERRPRGRFGLVQELRKRGVARDLAERMVEEVLEEEGIDEADVARRAAERWLGKQSEDAREALGSGEPEETARKLRRRLYAHLERRGFPRGVARRTLDRVVGELDDD